MSDTPKNVEFINAAEPRKQPGSASSINKPSLTPGQSAGANNEMSLEQMADMFIQVANDLVNTQKIGNVSRAMRLATSMFNSHEYSLKSPDMEVDRGDTIEWFVKEFRSMLEYHTDILKAQKEGKNSSC
jgi:hypothetical protein